MSIPNDVTDSTDWLNTPLSALAPLDAALRCQVCKDFFMTPMITSCSHTFCSLCIRRYLSQEGRCPACRESDQEIKLRRNWSIEEAVAQFKAGRDVLLKAAESLKQDQGENARPKKRRKIQHEASLPERRSTRSQSRKMVSQDTQNSYIVPSPQEEIHDSDEGSVYDDDYEATTQPQTSTEPHDGLVACPCCGRRMKEVLINAHLDKCIAGEATPSPPAGNTPQASAPPVSLASTQTKPTHQPERLPTMNYSLLTETTLRRKLKELGIPNHGSKDLMRKRHIEWMNLWNANCDSVRPILKSQLLRDLDKWERTLGKATDRGPTGVMVKDFDRGGWQRVNKGDFDELIRKAREKKKTVNTGPASAERDRPVSEERERQDDGISKHFAQNKPRSLEEISNYESQISGHEPILQDDLGDQKIQLPGGITDVAEPGASISGGLSNGGP